MDFRELRTFCAVAKLGSISGAARALNLGQPAATKHLKKLEEEVGTDLLLRGQAAHPAHDGRAVLLEMAGPLVEGMGALESFRFDLDQPRPVTVVTTPVLIAQVLPGPVRSFRQKYPDTLLRLWSGGEADILAKVASGEADLGIVPTADIPVGFDFAPLFTIRRVLAAPKGHPVTDQREISYSTLARWPLVMLSAASRTRILLDDAFRKRGISYDLAVETDSVEAIKQYVAGGAGISVLPDIAISPGDAAELDILPLSQPAAGGPCRGGDPARQADCRKWRRASSRRLVAWRSGTLWWGRDPPPHGMVGVASTCAVSPQPLDIEPKGAILYP